MMSARRVPFRQLHNHKCVIVIFSSRHALLIADTLHVRYLRYFRSNRFAELEVAIHLSDPGATFLKKLVAVAGLACGNSTGDRQAASEARAAACEEVADEGCDAARVGAVDLHSGRGASQLLSTWDWTR